MDDPNYENSGNLRTIEHNVVTVCEVPQTGLKSIGWGPCLRLSGIDTAVFINLVNQTVGRSWIVTSNVGPDLVKILLGRQT